MLISFRNMVKKYNMDVKGIIHIGAHLGQEIEDYIGMGIQNIMLFEPLSETFELLTEKASKMNANIEGYNVALGSESGKATMYVSDHNRISSSILKPKIHLEHHPNVAFPGKEDVEVDILDNYDCHDYNFINMDVQGYELEVLKGGAKILEQVDYVYCEVNRAEVYENNAMIYEIDEFLEGFDMVRKETDWGGQIWGDALYVRKSVL